MEPVNSELRTIFCSNLSNRVTEETLYELFLQAGPVQRVNIPKGPDGKQKAFGFVTYKHQSSVPYALKLFCDTRLFNRMLNMKPKNVTDSNQPLYLQQQQQQQNQNPYQQQQQQQMPMACPYPENFSFNQMFALGQQMLLGNSPGFQGMPLVPGPSYGSAPQSLMYGDRFADDRTGRFKDDRGFDEDRRGFDEDRRGFDEDRRGFDEDRRGFDEDRRGFDEDRQGLSHGRERDRERERERENHRQQQQQHHHQRNRDRDRDRSSIHRDRDNGNRNRNRHRKNDYTPYQSSASYNNKYKGRRK